MRVVLPAIAVTFIRPLTVRPLGQLLLALSLYWASPAAVWADDNPQPSFVTESVPISNAERELIVESALNSTNIPAGSRLARSIERGEVESVSVKKNISTPTPEEIEKYGVEKTTHYLARVKFKPIPLTERRTYQPVALCISDMTPSEWAHCQDDSWVRYEREGSGRPIRLNELLTDQDVVDILAFVVEERPTTPGNGLTIRPEDIFRLIKSRCSAERVSVFVNREGADWAESIFVSRKGGSKDGEYELVELDCEGCGTPRGR